MPDDTPPDEWPHVFHDEDITGPEQPDRRRMVPRFVVFERPARSAHTNDERLDARARAIGFNAAAAAGGWAIGPAHLILRVLRDCGRTEGAGGAVVLGCLAVFATALADRWLMALIRTLPEPFQAPLRLLARVPLASAVLALALYTPGTHWGTP